MVPRPAWSRDAKGGDGPAGMRTRRSATDLVSTSALGAGQSSRLSAEPLRKRLVGAGPTRAGTRPGLAGHLLPPLARSEPGVGLRLRRPTPGVLRGREASVTAGDAKGIGRRGPERDRAGGHGEPGSDSLRVYTGVLGDLPEGGRDLVSPHLAARNDCFRGPRGLSRRSTAHDSPRCAARSPPRRRCIQRLGHVLLESLPASAQRVAPPCDLAVRRAPMAPRLVVLRPSRPKVRI